MGQHGGHEVLRDLQHRGEALNPRRPRPPRPPPTRPTSPKSTARHPPTPPIHCGGPVTLKPACLLPSRPPRVPRGLRQAAFMRRARRPVLEEKARRGGRSDRRAGAPARFARGARSRLSSSRVVVARRRHGVDVAVGGALAAPEFAKGRVESDAALVAPQRVAVAHAELHVPLSRPVIFVREAATPAPSAM